MALDWVYKETAVPVNLIVDDHKYQTYIKVKILCDRVQTILKILEKGTLSNKSEMYIGLIIEAVCKVLHASHSSMIIWDY